MKGYKNTSETCNNGFVVGFFFLFFIKISLSPISFFLFCSIHNVSYMCYWILSAYYMTAFRNSALQGIIFHLTYF